MIPGANTARRVGPPASTSGGGGEGEGTTLLPQVTHESLTLGATYTRADVDAVYDTNWTKGVSGGGNGDRCTVATRYGESGLCVEVESPDASVGPKNTGASWQHNFGGSPGAEWYDEMWFKYDVCFRPGYEWAQGGKLPGLFGGTRPSGGLPEDDGFSARLVWKNGGRLTTYLYWEEQAGAYGTLHTWGTAANPRTITAGDTSIPADPDPGFARIVPGTWQTIEQRVLMNTDGNADGLIEQYLDGDKVLTINGIRFRETGDSTAWGIDGGYITYFFGGASAAAQSTRDEWIQWDNFEISTTRPS